MGASFQMDVDEAYDDPAITATVQEIRDRYGFGQTQRGIGGIENLMNRLFGEYEFGDVVDLKVTIFNEIAFLRRKYIESMDEETRGVPVPINQEINRAFKMLHEIRHFWLRARELDSVLAAEFDIAPPIPSEGTAEYHQRVLFRAEASVAHSARELGIQIPPEKLHWHWCPPRNVQDGDVKITTYQSFLFYILSTLEEAGYRKYEGALYDRVRTAGGNITPAFKRISSIEEYVRGDVIDRYINYNRWLESTSTPGIIKSTVDYLDKCIDPCLPTLQKTKATIFCFNNGVYVMSEFNKQFSMWVDAFYDYSGDERPNIPPDTAATKLIEQDLDWELVSSIGGSFMLIPTPAMDSIFQQQGYSSEEMQVCYAFLARCLHPVGRLDSWQMALFLRGIARTGE